MRQTIKRSELERQAAQAMDVMGDIFYDHDPKVGESDPEEIATKTILQAFETLLATVGVGTQELPATQHKFSVRVGENFVAIDYNGTEVLYWDCAEWEEDPEVTLVIANACRQAYEEPAKMLAFVQSKGLLADSMPEIEGAR